MGVPQWLSKMFTVDDTIIKTQFSLIDPNSDSASTGAQGQSGSNQNAADGTDGAADGADTSQGSEPDGQGSSRSGGSASGQGSSRSRGSASGQGNSRSGASATGQGSSCGRGSATTGQDNGQDAGSAPEQSGRSDAGQAKSQGKPGRSTRSDQKVFRPGSNDDKDRHDRFDEVDGMIVQRPIPLSEYVRHSEEQAAERKAAVSDEVPFIPEEIEVVRERLNRTFHLPENKDIVVRKFDVGVNQSWSAIAVFVDGMASTMVVNTNMLEPLMLLSNLQEHQPAKERIEVVSEALLPSNQISIVDRWEDVVAGILTGSTAILIDKSDAAIIAESKGWQHRSVGTPRKENVVVGPHQAFTEHFRANTGMIRALLQSPDLVTEMMTVGKMGKTNIGIMYMYGLTNERLVDEIRRRIQAVDVDYMPDAGILSQFIEDNPRVWVPQTLTTERPDRVAQMLTEGYVAIIVGQSSFALIAPMVFFGLMQAAEDAYLRFPFGSFLRIIRWVAVFAALLVPALFVSITNYHPEMIPTDLMMAVAGSREQVPFPVIVEVLLMELAIELIREAGIRIPSIIGPTIGIVGALIIGQAAVQAGIVSPLLVIVISVTALASFTIPNYNLQFGIRIMRFVFLMLAAFVGFYGVTLAIVAMLARLTVQQSLGVPLFSPAAPKSDSSRDAFLRGPAFEMNQRPLFLQPQKQWRQQPYTRPWSPSADPEPVLSETSQQDGGKKKRNTRSKRGKN